MTDAYQDRLEEAERGRQEAERLLTVLRTGMVERILHILDARGLAMTDAQRAQITACEEPVRLLDGFERASSAATVGDVLGP